MGWATPYIARLAQGHSVQLRPRGNSMQPRIRSGELCTVVPLASSQPPVVGDVVLCNVRGKQYLHLVKAVRGERYLIGNQRGGLNGWISRRAIYGRLATLHRQP